MQPASHRVDVSILMPTLNERRWIREAIRGMQAQQFDGTLELIVADGGSTDGTREIVREVARSDPRIRLVDNPRRGTASGLNVCLREARGAYVARMDAHTIYPPRYVSTGVERLTRGDVAWVAGPQEPHGATPFSRAVAAALRSRLGTGGSRRWGAGDDGEYELDTGVFCGVWRRADVVRAGGWDEGWPRNQDSEMASRFLSAGQRIVCVPAMAAQYRPRDTLRALWRQYHDYGLYRAKTARRHPFSLRRSALLPPLLALDLAVAVAAPPHAVRGLARAGLAAYAAALAATTAATARRARRWETALVPVVLATMHVAHGVGFWRGCARWGVPWRALLATVGGPAQPSVGAYAGPIDAPSLHARPQDGPRPADLERDDPAPIG